jgi:hypothetical protein
MTALLPTGHARLGAQPTEFQRSVVHLYPGVGAELLPMAATPSG